MPLKKIALTLLAIVFAYALFMLAMRLVPPTTEQQRALDQMQAPTPAVVGHDGSDAVWLLKHDVPAADRARIAAELREYLAAVDSGSTTPVLVDPRSKLTAFPKEPEAGKGVCAKRMPDCLGYVRDNLPLVESTLKANSGALAAALELQQFDGMRYGLMPSQTQEFPPADNGRRLVGTHFAYQFLTGDKESAIAGTCRDIAAWRRLGGNTDNLIGSMIGVGNVKQGLILLSEMLLDRPAGQALPESCTAALAPPLDYELTLCPTVALEHRSGAQNLYKELPTYDDMSAYTKFQIRYVMDKGNYDAIAAAGFAQYCGSAALGHARQDAETALWFDKGYKCTALRRWADPVGCSLGKGGGNSDMFIDYLDRRLDQAAAIALMNTVLWLRQQDENRDHWPSLLEVRPASLGLQRQPKIKDGRIDIKIFHDNKGEHFSLAIAPPPP